MLLSLLTRVFILVLDVTSIWSHLGKPNDDDNNSAKRRRKLPVSSSRTWMACKPPPEWSVFGQRHHLTPRSGCPSATSSMPRIVVEPEVFRNARRCHISFLFSHRHRNGSSRRPKLSDGRTYVAACRCADARRTFPRGRKSSSRRPCSIWARTGSFSSIPLCCCCSFMAML